MIIITGATGHLGRSIVLALLKHIPADQIGVSVRAPNKADALAALGVRVRHGDFDDLKSLAHAFEGATQVLIVSSDARRYGGDPLEQHHNAIEAARKAKARRVLYTSHMAASPTSAFPPMHDHAATEAMLATSGIAWTALRNGFYTSSAIDMTAQAARQNVLSGPQDGPASFTSHDDLAAAASAILLNEGCYDGPTPPLTSAVALTLAEVASRAAARLGGEVRREIVEDDQHREALIARGMPQRVVDISLGYFLASRRGEFASADRTLEQLIGRPPMSVEDVLKAT